MSIKSGTFAEACYNQNSIVELEDALLNGADETDMKTWSLSEAEWETHVKVAIFELSKAEFDSVELNGVEYALKQNAYISDSGLQYQASAINADCDEFTVYWDVTNGDPDNETDESNMCNWEEPAEVIAL